jgi:hypothetical protein
MKRLLFLILLSASIAAAQGNIPPSVLQAVPNATITVCSSVGGGIPCSPPVTIYSNAALTVVAPNPFTADANGNFVFYVAPNATGYIYSMTAGGITGQLFSILPQTSIVTGPTIVLPGATGTPSLLVASVDLLAQQANVPLTTAYAVPAAGGGMYRFDPYIVITQAASVSCVLPAINILWTDKDTSASEINNQTLAGNTSNGVGVIGQTSAIAMVGGIIYVKGGTNIQFTTAGYASVGGTPMQFAVHVRIEYVGP